MPWYSLIEFGTPLVFNPKVTPDPTDADRLEEKLQQAMRQLNQDARRGHMHPPELSADSVEVIN